MQANKYIFGYRKQITGVKESVWLALRDAKVATIVDREELFSTHMDCGCFIQHVTYETRQECNSNAIAIAKSFGCVFVTPEKFREAEAKREGERVAHAFEEAERLIREG